MTISPRDRRALISLSVVVVMIVIYRLATSQPETQVVQAALPSVDVAEKRLNLLRQTAATVPGKQTLLEAVSAQVAAREKKLLTAETAAQAQAQLLQIVRRVARAGGPPIEFTQVNLGPIQNFGKYYGEAVISVAFLCTIDQLVNLLADLSAAPELIATSDLQVQAGDAKQKQLTVRLTVSGLIPRKLVPERKGFSLF